MAKMRLLMTSSRRIVVTGANGFIGKNLCVRLRELGYSDVRRVTRETSDIELVSYLESADGRLEFSNGRFLRDSPGSVAEPKG